MSTPGDEAIPAANPDPAEIPPVLAKPAAVPLPQPVPVLTVIFLALSVGITLASFADYALVSRWLYGESIEIWLEWKWWTLLTSAFIHGSVFHLLFNCSWLWYFGAPLERALGRWRFAGLFALLAWISALAELAWSGQQGVGMSGVIYGLFGFMLANSREPAFAAVLTRSVLWLLLISLVGCMLATYYGLMLVANAAHVGGLVMGVVLGFTFTGHAQRRLAAVAAGLLFAVSLPGLRWMPWLDEWYVASAHWALERGDDATAIASLTRLRQAFPEYEWAATTESLLHVQCKEWPEALAARERVAETSNDEMVLNNLAWLLATCPDDRIRDGKRATKLAQRACEASEWKNAGFIDTLAAAWAEAGDFEEAVKWATQAVGLEDPAHTDELKTHLAAFRERRPWRE